MNTLWKIMTALSFAWTSISCAMSSNQFYGAIEGGIFQARFNSHFQDRTDFIPQNISDSVVQNGYTGGLAIGYMHLINPQYFINIELAGNADGNSALYQSGAANTSFSDKVTLANHIDFTLSPGIITQSDLFPYAKFGISYAWVHDSLTSPVGYTPITTQYNTSKDIFGFVAGLGVRYKLSNAIKLFVEANYHDYGTLNFSSFQNFTANYAHSAHLYTYSTVIGAMYTFNN